MRYWTVGLLLVSGLAGCELPSTGLPGPATSVASAVQSPWQDLPAEVVAFHERRSLCDHFRGEEAYDGQRAAILKAELARTCAGTDEALANLRRRYSANPKVIASLRPYEDRIE